MSVEINILSKVYNAIPAFSGRGLCALGLTYIATRVATQALSNLLALDTLRHGSSLHGYLGIRLLGGLPWRGGTKMGASHTKITTDGIHETGKFFMFTDPRCQPTQSKGDFEARLQVRLMPKLMTFLAACGPASQFRAIYIIQCIWGAMITLFIPTITFHFSPDWVASELKDDERCKMSACYSTKWIDPFHIGVFGIFRNGINFSWVKRARSYPTKVLTALPQFASAALLAHVAQRLLREHKSMWLRPVVIAGLIL